MFLYFIFKIQEISNGGVAVRSDYKFNIATVYKSDISEIRENTYF